MQPTLSSQSSQAYLQDPRNNDVQVYVNGEFVHRDNAVVSIFDSGYVCGDGVWEGLRLVNGRLIALDAHLDRLFEGAAAIQLDIGHSREALTAILYKTLAINGMTDGAHIRLMITRGKKHTPNQDPRFIIGGATIVCVAEYKVVDTAAKKRGLTLFTSTYRTSTPDVFDLRLNSHSRLNLIQALLQALQAGADEALMLDPHGFVASCNSTNFFIVRRGELWTSSGRYCFNGITRQTIIDLAQANGLTVKAQDFTLAEALTADEAFVTGTLAGITPVKALDGRPFSAEHRPVTEQLSRWYEAYLHAQ
ncbi:aminotransferase class IV [Pectobacterium brasiliense]|uniref:aminotransferase class IV n=1 Tax=Pectobacterium brasiliense TaxID=180957 RepID=UPI00069C5203|nr:aminotransferase class IV [Pectobacterium brasiliense]MBN3189402.1 aminotransferase class IV [Pectobacterium brasiliense]MCA5919333.1 aminotransferase class IV [Pectobacterium brasiliense]MCA5925928.1 aminotransferase class IV [Pectobacterium brasiliense]MCA5935704.1 aminotransferase class IV [Pectobacterium brasiliense]MCA5939905.1 aminotransferase class IV [Pectobacterium brasiliense]